MSRFILYNAAGRGKYGRSLWKCFCDEGWIDWGAIGGPCASSVQLKIKCQRCKGTGVMGHEKEGNQGRKEMLREIVIL